MVYYTPCMRILLVGVGNMGRKYLTKMAELGHTPILCDTDPDKRVNGFSFYCHVEEVKEQVDAAIVAIEPSEHVKVSKPLLEMGLPVLLEKPPALSYREFQKIEPYTHLYISEIETFSSCLKYFPEKVHTLSIERLGRSKGYVSPLWDLAWHDLYLLQLFFENIWITQVKTGELWEINGEADRIPFSLKVAWEHPAPSRRWVINEGELILDLAKEEVWVKGELLHSEPRDKLKLMLKAFLEGEFDKESRERAKRNLLLLEEAESLLRT